MGRSAASFRRSKPSLAQQPLVLVICEDTKSSKDYLVDAKVHYRATALVEVVNLGHTDPRGIVKKAVERAAKYDHVFCVIDRDTHPTFDEAVQLAHTKNNVHLITSYPCFEYWLYLHFQYSRRTYRRAGDNSPAQQMVRALKECEGMSDYDKGSTQSIFKKLLGRLEVAIQNGARSLEDAKRDNEPDPSTSIHTLIRRLEDLGRTKKLE